jgi:UDP-N-acetylmuramyl tripeptide synthase
MKLRNLIDQLNYKELVNMDDFSIDVENVSYNSKTCKPNDIFVCISGEHADGHEFFQEALNNGAAVCVVEKILNTDIVKFSYHNSNNQLIILSSVQLPSSE